MLVQLYVRNDGTGILDEEARDGDVLQIFEDSFEPSLGDQDKKSFLILKMPDPPNKSRVLSELTASDYGLDGEGQPVITRFRKFRLNWRSRFTAEEVAIIVDPLRTLGVVANRFTHLDFLRKN